MSGYRTRLRARVESNTAKFDRIFNVVVHSSRSSTCSESDSTSSFDSESSTSTHLSTPNKEKALLFVCSFCHGSFGKHSQFHAHIALEHGKTLIACSRCNATSYTLWKTNVCRVCKAFTMNLGEHEAAHYLDKEGKGAVFECPRCYRTFKEFMDLKKHLIFTHEKRAVVKDFSCQVCKECFQSRHQRDQHLILHFSSHLERLHDAANELEFVQRNQCSICGLALSSLRTFRLHVIYRHFLQKLPYSNQLIRDSETPSLMVDVTEVKVELKEPPTSEDTTTRNTSTTEMNPNLKQRKNIGPTIESLAV